MFDAARELYGDEQEWQARWKAVGGRIRFIPAAAVDHRRAGDDARLRSLCRAARMRGRASRRFDEFKGTAPSLRAELRTLAGCALHGPRHRCAMGPVMTWHSLGRLEALFAPPVSPALRDGDDAFTSGAGGTVAGVRGRCCEVVMGRSTCARRCRGAGAGSTARRATRRRGAVSSCSPSSVATSPRCSPARAPNWPVHATTCES